jgi:hypothetical protein
MVLRQRLLLPKVVNQILQIFHFWNFNILQHRARALSRAFELLLNARTINLRRIEFG